MAAGELHRMMNDTETFLYEKLTQGKDAHLTIGTGDKRHHMPVKKDEALKLLEKPAGYDALLRGIAELKKTAAAGNPSTGDITWDVRQIANFFELDVTGIVQFTASKATELEEKGKVYLHSETGQKLQQFIDGVNRLYYELGINEVKGMVPGTSNTFRVNVPAKIIADMVDTFEEATQSWTPSKDLIQGDSNWARWSK